MKNAVPRTVFVLLIALSGACRLNYTGGAKPVSAAVIDDGWHRAAATPIVRQQQPMDCGLAALAMIAGAWGQPTSVAELHAAVPPGDKGVKLGSLRDLARSRGF